MIWILLSSFDGQRKPEQQGMMEKIAEITKRMTQFRPYSLSVTPRTTLLPNLPTARLLELSVSISFED